MVQSIDLQIIALLLAFSGSVYVVLGLVGLGRRRRALAKGAEDGRPAVAARTPAMQPVAEREAARRVEIAARSVAQLDILMKMEPAARPAEGDGPPDQSRVVPFEGRHNR